MDLNILISKFKEIYNIISNFILNEGEWEISVYKEKIDKLLDIILEDNLLDINDERLKKELKLLKKENISYYEQIYSLNVIAYCYGIESGKYIDQQTYMDNIFKIKEELEEYIFKEESKENQNYYKNLLDSSDFDEFEEILEFLKQELRNYYVNLEYSEKIIRFIEEEFSIYGVFPTQLIFIKQFLKNAFDSMILTISKLYFDQGNINKKTNCGIKYLQIFLNKKLGQSIKSQKCILKEASKKIKETQTLGDNIVKVRNSLIAHCDIGKKSEVEQIVLQIETLKSIFENSVEILELLSLKYFECKTLFDKEMMDIHGFKKYVIKNLWIDNRYTDLDSFFKVLRSDFIYNLKK